MSWCHLKSICLLDAKKRFILFLFQNKQTKNYVEVQYFAVGNKSDCVPKTIMKESVLLVIDFLVFTHSKKQSIWRLKKQNKRNSNKIQKTMGQTSELLFYTKASTLKKLSDINSSVICIVCILCTFYKKVYTLQQFVR